MVRYIQDTQDFTDTLANQPADKLLVICYTASWCGPCQRVMKPVFEKLEPLAPNVTLIKVDVDECEEVAAEQEIQCMPTIHFYKGGEKVQEMEGADEIQFLNYVKDLC
jgi:thioredoxin 1